VLEIDGAAFSDFQGLCAEVSAKVFPAYEGGWHGNLDALNDMLRGGFGTPERGFVLRWVHAHRSRKSLGNAANARLLEKRLATCHPSNIVSMQKDLQRDKRGVGPTLFDEIVDIIRDHGPGGVQAAIAELMSCLPFATNDDQLAALDDVVGYYRTNAKRMRYRTFRARGLPVGSGIVESAHRHVLQVRMKRAGQRWSIPRARRMARLRAVYRTTGAVRFHAASALAFPTRPTPPPARTFSLRLGASSTPTPFTPAARSTGPPSPQSDPAPKTAHTNRTTGKDGGQSRSKAPMDTPAPKLVGAPLFPSKVRVLG
jgi:hypothetical protein